MRQIDLIRLYSQMKCLVVDDMPDVRVAISGMLRVFGVQHVDVVANGEQAMDACFGNHYHMVLCDYNLGPGRDGQQVLEELRYRNRLNNTSIFVMVTAETSREMVLGALEYQPDDYVAKPITQALLRQRLDRVLLRHRELYSIKQAMDEKDYAAAEQRCADRLNANTSYRGACLQIQAEMNLRLLNFKRAEDIYRGVLNERPVLWAKLGLGKTQVLKKEYAQAEGNLKEVIRDDRRVVEAHDLLADAYLGQGDTILAQQAMQDAAEVSPKSVMRQRRLAELSKLNADMQACLEASRRVIKTARNSVYESPDDYFNLARNLADMSKEGEPNADKYVKETFEVLQKLEKRPYFDVSADVQSNALKSRSLLNNNKAEAADPFLEKAKNLYNDRKEELKPEVGLDVAQTLIVKGDKAAADEVLHELVEKFPTHEAVVAKADSMSDTPKSKEGRKKVADMTKAGIDYYESKEYKKAVETFRNAIGIFPGHIGLNLNLVQAVIAEVKIHGEQTGYETLCRNSLSRISNIDPQDPQYARYSHLTKEVDELFKMDLSGLDIEW
ncbi:response regulator [Cellvibrio sp.]|uniref:response regulator n=1 Tax=Cellvibrio sp. TaxID=1965322 RepID=UPI003964861E